MLNQVEWHCDESLPVKIQKALETTKSSPGNSVPPIRRLTSNPSSSSLFAYPRVTGGIWLRVSLNDSPCEAMVFAVALPTDTLIRLMETESPKRRLVVNCNRKNDVTDSSMAVTSLSTSTRILLSSQLQDGEYDNGSNKPSNQIEFCEVSLHPPLRSYGLSAYLTAIIQQLPKTVRCVCVLPYDSLASRKPKTKPSPLLPKLAAQMTLAFTKAIRYHSEPVSLLYEHTRSLKQLQTTLCDMRDTIARRQWIQSSATTREFLTSSQHTETISSICQFELQRREAAALSAPPKFVQQTDGWFTCLTSPSNTDPSLYPHGNTIGMDVYLADVYGVVLCAIPGVSPMMARAIQQLFPTFDSLAETIIHRHDKDEAFTKLFVNLVEKTITIKDGTERKVGREMVQSIIEAMEAMTATITP